MAPSRLKTAAQVSKELLESAILQVKNGMSQNAAAIMFGVSRTTMMRHFKNPDTKPVGAPLKFPKWEEDRIAELLLACSKQGIPFNRYHCSQLFTEVALQLSK